MVQALVGPRDASFGVEKVRNAGTPVDQRGGDGRLAQPSPGYDAEITTRMAIQKSVDSLEDEPTTDEAACGSPNGGVEIVDVTSQSLLLFLSSMMTLMTILAQPVEKDVYV
jgi:hypothetical protein